MCGRWYVALIVCSVRHTKARTLALLTYQPTAAVLCHHIVTVDRHTPSHAWIQMPARACCPLRIPRRVGEVPRELWPDAGANGMLGVTMPEVRVPNTSFLGISFCFFSLAWYT